MKYDEIIARVAKRTGLFEGDAVALTRATWLPSPSASPAAEARELATHLPGPLQDALLPTREQAEPFGFYEFVNRVVERCRRDPTTVEGAVNAVMATLREAVTPDEFDAVLGRQPRVFHRLGAR